ncbi:hypothetical protein L204_100760 [Cryptococcus depauperatus]|nr:hypothetical protein L204_01307 [Cryptococcus depauperatus CBS 7855]
MEALSRREENDVMDTAKSEALKSCDKYVKDFAGCAGGRTFSLPFACREKLQTMQRCMKEYMTTERLDAMKLDYIARRSEMGKQAVEALKKSREERFKRMAGIKDEPARI